jgi:phage shock protein A
MDNVIAEYQKWKQQGHSLRTQARQAMEERFRDLLTEAAQVAQEYQNDFGVALKPPPSITAFRFKSATGKPGVKAKKTPSAPVPQAGKTPEKTANPKIAPLEKRLAQTREKLDAAKSAGKPTRNLEDRIYEIEDAIRLAVQTG